MASISSSISTAATAAPRDASPGVLVPNSIERGDLSTAAATAFLRAWADGWMQRTAGRTLTLASGRDGSQADSGVIVGHASTDGVPTSEAAEPRGKRLRGADTASGAPSRATRDSSSDAAAVVFHAEPDATATVAAHPHTTVVSAALDSTRSELTPLESLAAVAGDLQGAVGELNALLNLVNLIKPPGAPSAAASSQPLRYLFDRTTVVPPHPPAERYMRQALQARGHRAVQQETAGHSLSNVATQWAASRELDTRDDRDLRMLSAHGWRIIDRATLAQRTVDDAVAHARLAHAGDAQAAAAVRALAAAVSLDAGNAFPPSVLCLASHAYLPEVAPSPAPNAIAECTYRLYASLLPHPYISALPPWLPSGLASAVSSAAGLGVYAALVPAAFMVNAIPASITSPSGHALAVLARRAAAVFGVAESSRTGALELPPFAVVCPPGFTPVILQLSATAASGTDSVGVQAGGATVSTCEAGIDLEALLRDSHFPPAKIASSTGPAPNFAATLLAEALSSVEALLHQAVLSPAAAHAPPVNATEAALLAVAASLISHGALHAVASAAEFEYTASGAHASQSLDALGRRVWDTIYAAIVEHDAKHARGTGVSLMHTAVADAVTLRNAATGTALSLRLQRL